MALAPHFEQLLDDKLHTPGGNAPPSYGPWIGTAPFLGPIGGSELPAWVQDASHTDTGQTHQRTRLRSEGNRTGPRGDAVAYLRGLDGCLGPDPDARQLRAAFRRLARRFHPDRHPLASTAVKRECSEKFQAVYAAYRTLTETTSAS